MTSRNYLCKSIQENIRRNMFLTILISLAFLVVLPVSCIANLDGVSTEILNSELGLTGIQNEFLGCIGFENVVFIVVIAAGILYGLAGFMYLYSGEKTDFYHSLPLKREELFLVSLVSSLLSFLIPYLAAMGITYVIGLVSGGNSSYVLRTMGMALVTHVLYYLVTYAGTVLAILLTGNLFTGALGFAGIMSYGVIVNAAYNYLNDRFFRTLSYYGSGALEPYLSPITVYLQMNMVPSMDWSAMTFRNGILYGLIMAVLFLAADLWLYKIRPSESYHRAIAFPKLEPVIKVCSVIPIAFLAALLFSAGMQNDFLWMVVGTIVAALVLSFAFDFLYTMDIKSCIRPRISTGVILGVLVLVLAGYRMDITGVDSYLPDKEKIETMSVELGSISDRLYYPDKAYTVRAEALDTERLEDFDAVYRLAETGVAYYQKQDKDEAVSELPAEDQEYVRSTGEEITTMIQVNIGYHLKSGKDVYRSYIIPETEETLEAVGEIYDNWEYREKILPTSYANAEDIDFLSVIDVTGNQMQLDIQKDQLEILYKTYKNELESMTFAQSREQRILGYLCAEKKENLDFSTEYTSEWSLPVYENFTETRTMLEELGQPIEDSIPVEEVLEIKLSTTDEMGNTAGEVVLKEKEEMEQVLENLSFEEGHYGAGSKIEYQVYVEIIWQDRFQSQWKSLYLLNRGDMDALLEELKID